LQVSLTVSPGLDTFRGVRPACEGRRRRRGSDVTLVPGPTRPRRRELARVFSCTIGRLDEPSGERTDTISSVCIAG
jgi:hypothetical protein